MTPIGQHASDILEWAYGSPKDRVELAIQQVSELARRDLSQQERNEVTDAGTMLSRLQDSLATIPAETISSQVDR